MNNTLGLAVLMSIVYFNHVPWTFSVETLAIIGVTTTVGICGLSTRISYAIPCSCLIYFSRRRAVFVALLYPATLVFVAIGNAITR